MSDFSLELPTDNLIARQQLYAGTIYLLKPRQASLTLIGSVTEEVIKELGENYRLAHKIYDEAEYFERVGRLRKKIYTSESYHLLVNAVIDSTGFQLSEQVYDPARMRVVAHQGHLNPAASPIYHGHRDTWYSNPQSMITWWIPLHDVVAEETFDFYPDYFSRSVKNDSEIFDFGEWTSEGQANRIGWQNRKTGQTATYPSLLEEPQGRHWPVVAKAGQLLLFSGQHLHRTRKNVTGKTRFSLDFRTVNLEDEANKLEAQNVDNRSTGSSIVQFVRPK